MDAVLDHDANHDDIEAFLGRLQTALDDRHVALRGITTDGSPLSPELIRTMFGDGPPAFYRRPLSGATLKTPPGACPSPSLAAASRSRRQRLPQPAAVGCRSSAPLGVARQGATWTGASGWGTGACQGFPGARASGRPV
jgi:hypothetical protein